MKKITGFKIHEVSWMPDGTYEMRISKIKFMNDKEQLIQKIALLGLKVFYDRVLVAVDEEESKTSGGIIIPDSIKERPKKGTVVAHGPECLGNSLGLENAPKVYVGARIVFGKYAGSELKIDGIPLNLMRESDIFFSFPETADIKIEFL
jgi:chaperonin GroES